MIFTEEMHEGEKLLLLGAASRRQPVPSIGWDRLHPSVFGALWGRHGGHVEVSGAAAWVLHAEATR
ncbi:uncharacterized protein RMCC_2749 [Mycolicibacterium canariasense]|uniref:Uncharacterized protein n=1 Tax=Mycolicibacterium canariasense TaxID=228230 RepID=A0A100WD47_MYCCR|nr:uncharacterized protein RMCC_2749 [Mycolicibacterium canariasense]